MKTTSRSPHRNQVSRISSIPPASATRLKAASVDRDRDEDRSSVSLDPLEMHFRAMTNFRLLTREDEHALARRLELADLAIARTLLTLPEGRASLTEVVRQLREGESRVEDVERNPAENLLERLERAIAGKSSKTLRFHPRAVREVLVELNEVADRTRGPAGTKLRRAIADVEESLREADAVTTEFVQSNLRIVVTFARRYRGMPLVDLIQEGNLGLMRAVDKFDHRRGLRFSTYAAWWIRHALSRALADQSKMIRLPVHLTGAVQRVRRAQDRLLRETGHDATPEELATRTGLPLEQVKRALDVVPQPVSLDTPVGGTGEREGNDLVDFVVDHESESADEQVAERQLRVETSALLSELPEREAEIIRLRFGLGGGAQRTLEEIGVRLSLSRERARQLERDALKKLRVASEKRRLRAHLGQ